MVDAANIWTATLVAEHGYGGSPLPLFIEGGVLLGPEAFSRAAAAGNHHAAAAVIAPLVRQTPLAAATPAGPGAEERVREGLTREMRMLARREPLGIAPVIEYWLRLGGEAAAIRRITWGIAAGAPATMRLPEAVEA